MNGKTPNTPAYRCFDLLPAIAVLALHVGRRVAEAPEQSFRRLPDQGRTIRYLDRFGLAAVATRRRPAAEPLWSTLQAPRCAADMRRSRHRVVVHSHAHPLRATPRAIE